MKLPECHEPFPDTTGAATDGSVTHTCCGVPFCWTDAGWIPNGASGSFSTADKRVVTVVDGIITNIS